MKKWKQNKKQMVLWALFYIQKKIKVFIYEKKKKKNEKTKCHFCRREWILFLKTNDKKDMLLVVEIFGLNNSRLDSFANWRHYRTDGEAFRTSLEKKNFCFLICI